MGEHDVGFSFESTSAAIHSAASIRAKAFCLFAMTSGSFTKSVRRPGLRPRF